MLQCKDIFWKNYGISSGYSTTIVPIGNVYYFNNANNSLDETDKKGLVLLYSIGDNAFNATNKTTSQIERDVMSDLSKVHLGVVGSVAQMVAQDWNDQFTPGGPFIYLSVEGYTENSIKLMNGLPRIQFTTDAISWYPAWMQGAIESGLRATFLTHWNFQRNETMSQL